MKNQLKKIRSPLKTIIKIQINKIKLKKLTHKSGKVFEEERTFPAELFKEQSILTNEIFGLTIILMFTSVWI